ncbi:hypothetical protein LINGRAHAP2_LOCUS34281, partial [Linum grandiflorum]
HQITIPPLIFWLFIDRGKGDEIAATENEEGKRRRTQQGLQSDPNYEKALTGNPTLIRGIWQVDIKGYAELIRLSEHTLWRWQRHRRSWPPLLLVFASRCRLFNSLLMEQPTLWCVKRS